ncbi:MAG: sensory rhodopsin II transducer [Minisyncoccia bacterium]|jgi:hypothetical protein
MNSVQIHVSSNLPGVASTTSIAGIVSGFYGFALLIAGILAFGAIVYGGIKYAASRGNPSAESEGKSWVTNALLGLLLLAGAYIILYTVNPQLVSLQITGLTPLPASPAQPTSTTPTPSGGTCSTISDPSNPCSISSVQAACSAWDPNLASQVCNKESGGGTNPGVQSGTDKCSDGTSFSIGLWQINVISTPGVPSACSFTEDTSPSTKGAGCNGSYSSKQAQGYCLECKTGGGGLYCSKWSCSFNSSGNYNDCVSGVASMNNQLACTLYRGSKGGSFCPWKYTANLCSISVPC